MLHVCIASQAYSATVSRSETGGPRPGAVGTGGRLLAAPSLSALGPGRLAFSPDVFSVVLGRVRSRHVGAAARCGRVFLFPIILGKELFSKTCLDGISSASESLTRVPAPPGQRACGSHTPKPGGQGPAPGVARASAGSLLAPPTGTSGRHWSGRFAPQRVPAQVPASRRLSLHFVFQPSAGPAQPHRGVRDTAAGHVLDTAEPLTSSPGPSLDAGVPTATREERTVARAVAAVCAGVGTRSGRRLRGGPRPDGAPVVKLLPQVDVF